MSRNLLLLLAAIAVLSIFLILTPLALKKFFKKSKLKRDEYQKKWQKIYDLLGSREGRALSVIEADKLLDKALIDLQIKGNTMGERLVSAQPRFSDVNHVWRAHKLRNKMVHESGYQPKGQEIKDALLGFRRGLKDLGAL